MIETTEEKLERLNRELLEVLKNSKINDFDRGETIIRIFKSLSNECRYKMLTIDHLNKDVEELKKNLEDQEKKIGILNSLPF